MAMSFAAAVHRTIPMRPMVAPPVAVVVPVIPSTSPPLPQFAGLDIIDFPPPPHIHDQLISILSACPTRPSSAARLSGIPFTIFECWWQRAHAARNTILFNPKGPAIALATLSPLDLQYLSWLESIETAVDKYKNVTTEHLHRQLFVPQDEGGGVRTRTYRELIVRDATGTPIIDPNTNDIQKTRVMVSERITDDPNTALRYLAARWPEEYGVRVKHTGDIKHDHHHTDDTASKLQDIVNALDTSEQAAFARLLEKGMSAITAAAEIRTTPDVIITKV